MKSSTPFNRTKLLFASLLAMLIVGCTCAIDQPEATFYAPIKGATHHHISAEQYGRAVIKPGDTLTLEFPCAPEMPELPEGLSGMKNEYSITLWSDESQAERMKMASSLQPAHFSHTIQFTHPVYQLALQSGEPFLPGDANRDGKRDMMDLYPIARVLWQLGGSAHTDWDLPYPAGVPLAGPLDTNFTYLRTPTGLTWDWDGTPIDYMHADCNYDGTVNAQDLELLKKVLQPLKLPNFLTGAYSGVKLKASPNGTVESFTPDPTTQNPNPTPQIRAWYDITVDTPKDNDTILGVVFTRAVDEMPGNPPAVPATYTVLDISANSLGSDLFATQAEMLWHQRYWKDLEIDLDSCEVLPDVVTRPLDVGVFNVFGPQPMPSGSKVINCCVTLDDLLKSISNGGPIYQHLINVVVFYYDGETGEIRIASTDCEFDDYDVNPDDIKVYEKAPSDWPQGSGRRGK